MTDQNQNTTGQEKQQDKQDNQQKLDEKLRREELEDRAKRPLIVQETVPGEDPISPPGDPVAKEKASRSTSDEDLR